MTGLTRKSATAIAIGGLLFFAAIELATVFAFPGLSDSLLDSIRLAFIMLQTIWCLLWIQPIRRAATSDYMRMLQLLNEQCDPEAFLNAQQKLYARACRLKKIRSISSLPAVTIRMNQAVALSFAGRHNEAMDEVNAILALPVKKDKDYFHGLCHINLSIFHARRSEDGDMAAAREHLKEAGECLKTVGQLHSTLYGEIIRAEYMIDSAEGRNLEAALDYFRKNLEIAPVARAAAANRYQLALIYRRLGDSANERSNLESVAQTVPKAHIGKLAASRLAELSAQ